VAPAQAGFISPDWQSLDIKSLAFMGAASAGVDEESRITAEHVIEQELLSGQERFVVIGLSEARLRAGGKGASEAFDRTVRVWKDTRKADQFVVQDVCRALGVDGLVFANVTDWEKKRSGVDTDGNSYTQVTIGLNIFSAKTGLDVWHAQKLEHKEAAQPVADDIADPVHTMDENKRITHANAAVPDPPRPEDVAADAVRSVMAAFPPRAN